MSGRFARARHVLAVVSTVVTVLAGSLALPGWATADPPPPVVTYTKTQTIPVPPASSYTGSAGGDGWSLAFSATEVFNVFHHQGTLQVACHLQSDASACYSPVTVQDADGKDFGASGHPGMWLDPASSKLYVYATRNDGTSGVVCFDTLHAATAPFCGFTALTAVGDGYYSGLSGLSEPVVVGTRFFAFNYYGGAAATGGKNTLLCFDLTTDAACAGQPYAVAFAAGTSQVGSFPEPSIAVIAAKIVISNEVNDGVTTLEQLSCFDPATGATCSGSWPAAAPGGYTGNFGAPFPLLSAAGAVRGFCLPTGSDPCYDLSGGTVATPAGLPAAVTASDGWNGPAVVIGPRIYVANGNENNVVHCYDAATDAECVNFPKALDNVGYIYTATADPARPSCIWVNADFGSGQIQNFDAFTGGACGQGPIRVLASSFVVAAPACTPGAYSSLTVSSPAPGTYTSGSVQFLDGDATQLPGIADRSIAATGAVDLSGLDLSSPSGLPQFLITLTGFVGQPSAVTVTLVWSGVSDPSCVKSGTTVVTPPTTQPQTITFAQPTSPDVVGHVQTLSATGGASGNPVVLTLDPSSTAGACTLVGATLTALHVGTCVVDADQAGSATYDPAPRVQRTVSVGRASTQTALTVQRTAFTARVTAVAPGAGVPAGRVTFSAGGRAVGSARLVGGTATLRNIASGLSAQEVSARYAGNVDFLPSSASVTRKDPVLTTVLSSAKPRSPSGWYRAAVTVAFRCTPAGAPLTAPCPGPVVLRRDGGGQTVSRTISATDGGMATASVTVSIDSVAPHVRVADVSLTTEYAQPPVGRCVGSDRLSGLASCRLDRTTVGHTEVYLATAVDRAGNRATQRLDAHLSPVQIQGAPFREGAYTVRLGHRYTLTAVGRTRPQYIDAAPYPQQPSGPDAYFRRTGRNTWTLSVDFTMSLRVSTYWNIGIRIGGTVHVLTVRVRR